MQVSDFIAILKADFGRFRPVSADFRPVSVVSAVSAAGRYVRYGRYGPNLAESARFGANRSRFGANRSRIGTNRAASARIEPSRRESEKKKKKKKNPDAVRRAGNRVGRRVPRRAALDAGAAPLVPRPCFLAFLMPCSKSPCVPV